MDQTIKGRPKIVGNLPDANPPIEKDWGVVRSDAIDVIARLRITLGPDYVIGRVIPNSEHYIVEDLDFTFCTPYLEARANERGA